MKAALIPPKGYEDTALMSNIHLVLPLPPLIRNLNYVTTYVEAHKRGDYIILDNGCAEAQLVDGSTLIRFAEMIGAHEIVAPDVMGDAAGTHILTRGFLQAFPNAANYNIMGVLQGKTKGDRIWLLNKFARMSEITTIGVPKVLVDQHGMHARLTVVEIINELFPDRFKIHLLGLSKTNPTEMLNTPFPETVRSMDSAQPYKLAQVGKALCAVSPWAPRIETYFTHKRAIDPHVLKDNIQTFKDWAATHEG